MHQTYFYGHGVFPIGLVSDVGLALLAPGWMVLLPFVLASTRSKLAKTLASWWTLLMMPNSAYLFMEIKHIILTDGIADDRPTRAVVCFATMSCLGLVTAVLTIVIAVRKFAWMSVRPRFSIMGLSLLSAIGAMIGQYDLTTIQAFLCPPLIGWWLVKLASNPQSLLIIAGLTVLLGSLSLVCERLSRPATVILKHELVAA